MKNYVISLILHEENGEKVYFFTNVCKCINVKIAMQETAKAANKFNGLPENTAWALSQPIYS